MHDARLTLVRAASTQIKVPEGAIPGTMLMVPFMASLPDEDDDEATASGVSEASGAATAAGVGSNMEPAADACTSVAGLQDDSTDEEVHTPVVKGPRKPDQLASSNRDLVSLRSEQREVGSGQGMVCIVNVNQFEHAALASHTAHTPSETTAWSLQTKS